MGGLGPGGTEGLPGWREEPELEKNRTERVHIHYQYGIRYRIRKTIPAMVLGTELHNGSACGPSGKQNERESQLLARPGRQKE